MLQFIEMTASTKTEDWLPLLFSACSQCRLRKSTLYFWNNILFNFNLILHSMNVLSSEVALQLVNWHIGPQGVQPTAILVCSGGSFHERTEDVLGKVMLLSKNWCLSSFFCIVSILTWKLSVCMSKKNIVKLHFIITSCLDSLDAISSRVALRLLNRFIDP